MVFDDFFFLTAVHVFSMLSTPIQPAGEGGTEEALISGCSPVVVVVPVATGAKIWTNFGSIDPVAHEQPMKHHRGDLHWEPTQTKP